MAAAVCAAGRRYPGAVRVGEDTWETFTPFLAFSPPVRKLLYTTNSVESYMALGVRWQADGALAHRGMQRSAAPRVSLRVEVAMDAAADAEFSEFMAGRWSALVRLGYGLTGDLQHAEDLAQTAFALAYASWGRVRRADDPDAYLRRIVVNANRNRFRKLRVPEVLTASVPELVSATDGADEQHRRHALVGALLQLPYGQRAAVVLRYWLDLTETETAAVLGCSVGNVKSQSSRALAKLRANSALLEGGLL